MPDYNFCISAGHDVASPTNIETLFTDTDAPSVLPDGLVPYLGDVKTRAGSGKARRDGNVIRKWRWPSMLHDDYNALVMAVWGNFTTASAAATIITIDETRRYAKFNVYADKPHHGENFVSATGGYYIADVEMEYLVIESLGEHTAEFTDEFTL